MIHYYYQEKKDSKKAAKGKYETYPEFVIKYCEQCNSELVSTGFGYNCDEYTPAFRASWKLSHCPICGADLVRKKNYHICSNNVGIDYNEDLEGCPSVWHSYEELDGPLEQGANVVTKYGRGVVIGSDEENRRYQVHYSSDCNGNAELAIEYLRSFRKKGFEEEAEKRLNIFLEKCSVNTPNTLNNGSNNTSFELKTYLSQIVLLETNIYAVTKRLQQLYTLGVEAEKDAFAAERIIILENNKLVEKTLADYETIKVMDMTSTITKDQFPIAYPNKPSEPIKPNSPVLAKPNLFNKKRVLAENAVLEKKYQDDLRQYEAEYEQYELELTKYHINVEELKKEQQAKYSAAIQKAQDKHDAECEKVKRVYDDALEKQKELERTVQEIKTPQKVKSFLLQEEIKTAEETLEKHYMALGQLYGYGIVFEKYRNLVAIAQIYEYISSSRCDKLEGADGAYNLYENEIRMNMVISQLAQIAESLEQIKENQYMIYSAVSETNRQLDKLNASMNRAVESLGNIETTNEIIANNSEIIAYNTEQTAFYAKKNAELTDALGYMVAMR